MLQRETRLCEFCKTCASSKSAESKSLRKWMSVRRSQTGTSGSIIGPGDILVEKCLKESAVPQEIGITVPETVPGLF